MDGISLSVQKRSEVLGKQFVDQAVKLAGKSYDMQRVAFCPANVMKRFLMAE